MEVKLFLISFSVQILPSGGMPSHNKKKQREKKTFVLVNLITDKNRYRNQILDEQREKDDPNWINRRFCGGLIFRFFKLTF